MRESLAISDIDVNEQLHLGEKSQSLLDGITHYAIFMLNVEGCIQTWNKGAQKILGYNAVEVLGKSYEILSLNCAIVKNVPQQSLETAKEKGFFKTNDWQIRKDGSRFLAHIHINPLYSGERQLQGFGCVIHVWTELNVQQERFQQMIELIPSGVVLVDAIGSICACNSDAEKMFGYESGKLVGQSVDVLIPERHRRVRSAYHSEFLRNTERRKIGVGRDLTGVTKEGVEFPIEIGLVPFQSAYGNYVLATIVDITERKHIEDELHKAYRSVQLKNEEMEQFVYSVSHDLKAPLVTGSSFIGFLKEDLAANRMEEVRNAIDRIERAHSRMKELIDDLLELSRVGRLSLSFESVNLGSLIQEALDASREKIEEQKVEVSVSDNFPSVVADPKRIRQVFDNLIGNALKYGASQHPAMVDIFWKENEEEYQICVKDNGKRIEPKYHKKIFGLFHRLENGLEGTGVGLTIVSRIAQLHGGQAWVVSDKNVGAEFYFSISKKLGKQGRR